MEETVIDIFKEMLKEQEQTLVNISSDSSDLINKTIHKLIVEIKESSNRLENILKDTDELKLSLELYHEINDNKVKKLEESIKK